ncbi:MAG: Flp pilus assembly complex ATPase component TadA [Aquimonas sp.]|nr:Flp pilus assembly complex ATPase component TadA [Xanthomonadales bacterium]MCC6504996.1 Flp pilus assembly complex ATPase component TadA [Aquimonas sp.]
MSIEQLEILHSKDWHSVRDIYVPVEVSGDSPSFKVESTRLDQTVVYAGRIQPYRLDLANDPEARNILQTLIFSSDRDRARIEMNERKYRAQRMQTATGETIALRSIPDVVPAIEQLQMPIGIRALWLDPELLSGGLALVVGTNGQGKTTTASAAIVSRLKQFSGFGIGVEDPPELPLDGFHGKGRFFQVPAFSDNPTEGPGSGYAQALLAAQRFVPSLPAGGSIVFFGEIRDARTALEALLMASNGHLVIATMHGQSVGAALRKLTTWAMATAEQTPQEVVWRLLAESLRLVQHQQLQHNWSENKEDKDKKRERWDEAVVNCSILSMQGEKNKPLYDVVVAGQIEKIAAYARAHSSLINKSESSSAYQIKQELMAAKIT